MTELEQEPWTSPLDQAVAFAAQLAGGLIGAESTPASPARWLEGVPTLEHVGSWIQPIGTPLEIWVLGEPDQQEETE